MKLQVTQLKSFERVLLDKMFLQESCPNSLKANASRIVGSIFHICINIVQISIDKLKCLYSQMQIAFIDMASRPYSLHSIWAEESYTFPRGRIDTSSWVPFLPRPQRYSSRRYLQPSFRKTAQGSWLRMLFRKQPQSQALSNLWQSNLLVTSF